MPLTKEQIKKQLENELTRFYTIFPLLIFSIFVYADITDDKLNWFNSKNLETYLSITAEILSAVLGLAIPLALTVIQMIQARMKTTKLTRVFISEHVYCMQIILLFMNIGVIGLHSLTNSIPNFWIICVVIFFLSMVYLIRFIFLIHKYVADLETHLAERFDEDIERFFQ